MFEFTDSEILKIKSKVKSYPQSKAALIEVLKIIQKERRWINTDIIFALSNLLNISVSEIEGIATFYSHIFRKPVGYNIIRYCDSMVCFVNGYQKIELELKKILKINIGETTKNKRFTLLPTCCLGACDKGPVLLINEDLYTHVKVSKIYNFLEKYK